MKRGVNAVFAVLLIQLLFPAAAFTQQPADAPAQDDFVKSVFFGRRFADLGEYAAAAEQYAKADAAKPDQPEVLYDLAVVLARAGRYAEAQVKADRYLQLFPEGAEKANVQKLQLELDFQRELQKKRQADQDYADLFNRAKFSYGRGELEDALRLFQQAEQLRPTDAAAAFNEAVVLEKLGQYAKAIERFRRYGELETDMDRKASVDERTFALQRELDDMQTKIVCSFCGRKLPAGATWCERCWHGPYSVKSPLWSSRPCLAGASATRATYFSDGRFSRNEVLPCLWKDGSMLETLRYSAAKQRAIQNARKAEGWTYSGDVIQGNPQIQFEQGPEYLERIASNDAGEILTYAAHEQGEGIWLLDREDLVIDATRYMSQYAYDAEGRIAQQKVDYQNSGACGHLISMTADFAYENDTLMNATIRGGYEGFPAEGSPKVEWQAGIAYGYDTKGRLANEELSVGSFSKTYMTKPAGELRDEIGRVYPGMRVKKPVESILRTGDVCAVSGTSLITNTIDLRPFYAVSPNLAIELPAGVTKATVTFAYPP